MVWCVSSVMTRKILVLQFKQFYSTNMARSHNNMINGTMTIPIARICMHKATMMHKMFSECSTYIRSLKMIVKSLILLEWIEILG